MSNSFYSKLKSDWSGRIIIAIAILLLGFNLRTAVAAFSPIFYLISPDIKAHVSLLSVIGMLPALVFALSGFITPMLNKFLSIDALTLLSISLLFLGSLGRAIALDAFFMVTSSAILFVGVGFGNVVLPPLIKKYFPDKIPLISTVYLTAMSIGVTIPPLVAVQVSEKYSWRFALGIWAFSAFVALIPIAVNYFIVRSKNRNTESLDKAREDFQSKTEKTADNIKDEKITFKKLSKNRVANALTVIFTVSSIQAYTMFTWLSEMLVAMTESSRTEAANLLALFAVMVLPGSFLVPYIYKRFKRRELVIIFGFATGASGFLGLIIFHDQLVWLWVLLIGFAAVLFPAALVLINLSVKDYKNATVLSSYVQSIGYSFASVGPLAVALIYSISNSWEIICVFMIILFLPLIWAARVVAKGRTIEEV